MLTPALHADVAVRALGRTPPKGQSTDSHPANFSAPFEPAVLNGTQGGERRSVADQLNALLFRQMTEALVPKSGLLGAKSTLTTDVVRTMLVDAITTLAAAKTIQREATATNTGTAP